MNIAVLAPVAWRTPPRHYGPWELVASTITEGLVQAGHEVTLFATADSETRGRLDAVVDRGYEEDRSRDAKVAECLHISNLMEQAERFDIIHNHFDFLPLTYSRLIHTPMITTIHGFSSEKIVEVYRKYNSNNHYVSISDSDRHPDLHYLRTIHHGMDTSQFTFCGSPGHYLLSFGRIHPDKGTHEAILIAQKTGMPLVIAGIIQESAYFEEKVRPFLTDHITFIGEAGPEKRNQLLGKASALLHPIGFNEPFGLSVAEAMLCGTPVIAYNRGSMPELIAEGRTGYLVGTVEQAAQAVGKLGEIDRAYCRSWAEKRFSAQRMVNEYIEAYHEILHW